MTSRMLSMRRLDLTVNGERQVHLKRHDTMCQRNA
jgi:hypothetical protein